jgi:uncharacterized protein YodC (DUF2158 family)
LTDKSPKFKVGEYVDVNHKGNAMRISSYKYEDTKREFIYSLYAAKDYAGFSAKESELREVNKDMLIEDLTENVQELSSHLINASREIERLKNGG